MAGSSSARMGRIGRQIVAVMVLSLILGGLATSPAAANQRGTAVNEANNVISACFKADGNPWGTWASDRYIGVICEYDDGTMNCSWWADDGWEADCYWTPNSVVQNPDGRGPDADTLHPGRASGSRGAAALSGDGAPTTVAADSDDQDTGKHHQKGKGKGKKHGKAKGHHQGGKRR